MLAFVDTKKPPEGAVDFDELTIAYRNYNLLLPGNGGKLLSSPPGSDDASRLTDGWRHGPGRQWRSAADPAGPQEFVWAFDRPVTVTAVTPVTGDAVPFMFVPVKLKLPAPSPVIVAVSPAAP